MSQELLSGAPKDLTRCDIFSLGATMYEICLGRPLPANGREWREMRGGKLESPLHRTHPELECMITEMMRPNPSERPAAGGLLSRRQLLSDEQKLLLAEKNRAREANLALAAHEEKMRGMDQSLLPSSGVGAFGAGGGGRNDGVSARFERPMKKLERSVSCLL